MTTLVAVSTQEHAVIGSDSRVTNSRGNWVDGVKKITSIGDLLVAQTGDVAVTEMMVDIIENSLSGVAPSPECVLAERVSICSPVKGARCLKPGSFSPRAYLSKTSCVRQVAAAIRQGVGGLCDNSAVMVAGLNDFLLVFWSDGSFYTPLTTHGQALIGAEGSGGAYALGAITALLQAFPVKLDHPSAVETLVREVVSSAVLCDRDSGGDVMVAIVTAG